MGVLPSSSELASGGVRELDAEEEEIGSASREPSSGMVLRPGPTGAEGGGKARSPMDNLRAGLPPPISKRLVERIQSNESIDFAELPSAKGQSWPNSQLGDNQIVVVQAADLMQSRRVIPDLAAWLQCYALYYTLYKTVLLAHQPGRLADLMDYQALIAVGPGRWQEVKN